MSGITCSSLVFLLLQVLWPMEAPLAIPVQPIVRKSLRDVHKSKTWWILL
jgi:hypothetical protein